MNARALLLVVVPVLVAGACAWAWLGGEPREAARADAAGALERGRGDVALEGEEPAEMRAGDAPREDGGARVQPGAAGGLFVLHGSLRDPAGKLLPAWTGALQLVASSPTQTIDIVGKPLYAAQLDGLGGYRFEGLPAGEYIAFAYSGLIEPLHVAFELTGDPRGVQRDFELRVPMVVDVFAADPQEFAALAMFANSGAHHLLLTASVARGVDGEREVARLTPDTDSLLEFRVEHPGHLGQLVVNAHPPVTLRLVYGSWVVDELRVEQWTDTWRVGATDAGIESVVGEVRVRFVDAERRPTRLGHATLYARGGDRPAWERPYSDGTYRFRLVPPGDYLLTLSAPRADDRMTWIRSSRDGSEWSAPDSGARPPAGGADEESPADAPTAGPIAVSVAPGALVDLGDVTFEPARAFRARLAGLADDDPRGAVIEYALLRRGATNELFDYRTDYARDELRELLPGGEFAVRATVDAEPVGGAPKPAFGALEPRVKLGTHWLVFDADALPTEALVQLEPLHPLVVQNATAGPCDWILRDERGLRVAGGSLDADASALVDVPIGRFAVESVDAEGGVQRQAVRVSAPGTTLRLGAR